jgi:hypothetical protein
MQPTPPAPPTPPVEFPVVINTPEGRSALIRHLWRGTVTFQQWGRGDRRTSVF